MSVITLAVSWGGRISLDFSGRIFWKEHLNASPEVQISRGLSSRVTLF